VRSASSYRGARKQMAKEVGLPLSKFNQVFDVAARAAEAAPRGDEQAAARKKLAIWAANGGRETALTPPISDPALERMNAATVEHALKTTPPEVPIEPIAPATVEAAVEATKKLTAWQSAGHEGPIPLNPMFAARARGLGWVEKVEFVEEK
jgi:hypothetical protein